MEALIRPLMDGRNRGPETISDGVTLRLCGENGSPYTNKMLALLRYRRVPHRFVKMNSVEEVGLAAPPVPKAAQRLLPKIVWPDGTASNDSTFLVGMVETKYRRMARSVVPVHGGLQFLSDLMEDWADEWLCKAMYHYRWTHDPAFAGKMIGLQLCGAAGDATSVDTVGTMLQDRQVARREVVGSNPTTYAEIEAGFMRFLHLLDAHLAAGFPFLLGTRPSAADFAMFGQLHPMLALDPETSRRVRAQSIRVASWHADMQDLSGFSVLDESKGWLDCTQPLPATLTALLHEMGHSYAPFLLANHDAVQAKHTQFECKVDGGRVRWQQQSFKYQSKCLVWLREGFARLNREEQAWVLACLAGTGCETLLPSLQASL